MYLQRNIAGSITEALDALPVVVVTGPRQAGKSTLLQQDRRLRGRRYLSLDNLTVLNQVRRDPDAILSGREDLTIDEAQRAPELFGAIKRAVDGDRRNGRFLLSGSANFLLSCQAADQIAETVFL